MTIRERIFSRLNELNMTQKEFSDKTGISQSAISEWKSKKTNPTTDKVMVICQVLKVSPEWLLSGVEKEGKRGNNLNFMVIDKDSEMGVFIKDYNKLSHDSRERLMGYMKALKDIDNPVSHKNKK